MKHSSAEMDFDKIYSDRKNVLLRAYCDLIYLLDKGYPKMSALTFVTNHYKISKSERSILNRAAFSLTDVEAINSKKIKDPSILGGKVIIVDLYNQYTSYQSVLDNDPIILARDGVVRDIFSILHSKKDLRINSQMVESFLSSLIELNPKHMYLFFDKQRSKSKEHIRIFNRILKQYKIAGSCVILKAVDHHLKSQTDSIILSHDSIVLKNVNFCFDFIYWYIKEKNLKWKIEKQFISFQCEEPRTNSL